MTAEPGRFSAIRMNTLLERAHERAMGVVDMLVDALLADGVPPFKERRSDGDLYRILSAMQQTNDPRFTESPAAQAMLRRLEAKFGPAPPQVGTPYVPEAEVDTPYEVVP